MHALNEESERRERCSVLRPRCAALTEPGRARGWEGESCQGKSSLRVLCGWACCLRRRPRSSASSARRRWGCASGRWAWAAPCAPRAWPWPAWWRGSRSWSPCAPGRTGRTWAGTGNTFRGQSKQRRAGINCFFHVHGLSLWRILDQEY